MNDKLYKQYENPDFITVTYDMQASVKGQLTQLDVI